MRNADADKHRNRPATLDRAKELRGAMTKAERRIWFRLRRHQIDGAIFRRQVPIGPYIADFACLERKLIVELDGGQHDERADADARRTRWLESHGYRVMRFWNNEVIEDLERVVFDIAEAVRAASGK